MRLEDETLMAYADGELPPLEAKRIEAAMAEDAALAARVARFRSVRRALRTAYDSVAAEPIPDHLRALLGDVALNEPDAPAVADLGAVRERRRTMRFGPPAWAAIAASLVIGVLAGRMVAPPPFFAAEGGDLYAGPGLAHVLDTRLASAPENASAETRVGLSFSANDGAVCRTFSRGADDGAIAGLACREGARWSVRMAVSAASARGDYRQAGASAPEVLALVDSMIAGEPFDASRERASRDRQWRD